MSSRRGMLLAALFGIISLSGCTGEPPEASLDELATLAKVTTELTYLKDAEGRYVLLHGANVSGSTKAPPTEVFGAMDDDVSYVGDPFPLDEADQWLGLLRDNGFDTIRLVMMWEAIEPHAKGEYDEEYLDYLEALVAKAADYGIYVLLDMHQDMFSRHMYVKYTEPAYLPDSVDPSSIEGMLLSLFPGTEGTYTNWVRGDGAPLWAVKACLQEKQFDSPHWGTPRLVGGLSANDSPENLLAVLQAYGALAGDDGGEPPPWVSDLLDFAATNEAFGFDETNDMLPWTGWWLDYLLSSDVERLYTCMFASQDVFPDLTVGDVPVQDYLQEAYADTWVEVATRMAPYDNVIGYDVINEPGGFFVMMSLLGVYFATGTTDGLEPLLMDLAGPELGANLWTIITGFNLLPPDASDETKQQWGYGSYDLFKLLGLNMGFDKNYLEPFYEKVGGAIQEADPGAVIWIEGTTSFELAFGGGGYGTFEMLMERPEGLDHVVYAPHWYPDIYPFPGFNAAPRSFTAEQVMYRDYTDKLSEAAWKAPYTLGNPPVVFGEFGTYFNFDGIEASIDSDYLVSAHLLDGMYEAFEALFQSRIVWCFSADNSHEDGEGWNKENFSFVDPDGEVRAAGALVRPHARLLAGKPIETHFYSDYHYFDPDKGMVDPLHEFYVAYASKETDGPSVIYTAEAVQYPSGFYVWLSDGYAVYDAERQLLYHYPTEDAPGAVHWVRLLPPLDGMAPTGWRYFVHDGEVVDGPGGAGS